jgi:hypothetical protein
MTDFQHRLRRTAALQDRFGLRVAARLSAGAEQLPHDIEQRLRVARQQALARRKTVLAAARTRTAGEMLRNNNSAILGFGDDGLGFWGRMASAALVVALAVGLVTTNVVQSDNRTVEVADLDAALLTDDLPPQAYSDPGFMQYLRASAAPAAGATH